MSHCISGLVANTSLLAKIATDHDLEPAAPLSYGDFAFLALDEVNLDGIVGLNFSEPVEVGFEFLTPSFIDWLRSCSDGGDLVYLETEYFGGTGTQGAVGFRDGARVFGPASGGIGTINAAMIGLGVPDTPPLDPFDRIGLSDHRSNSRFRREAIAKRAATEDKPGLMPIPAVSDKGSAQD